VDTGIVIAPKSRHILLFSRTIRGERDTEFLELPTGLTQKQHFAVQEIAA